MKTENRTRIGLANWAVFGIVGVVFLGTSGQLCAVVVAPSPVDSDTLLWPQGAAERERSSSSVAEPAPAPEPYPERGPERILPPEYSQPGGSQQPAPGPQALPLPPTYTPGSPASYGPAPAIDDLPRPPTAYGLYDSPLTAAPNTASSAAERGMGLIGPGARRAPGIQGGPLNQPGTPTSTPSLGVLQSHPIYGPYSSSNMAQATAPREAASVGQSRAATVSRRKPFSGYKVKSPVSPYMTLGRERDSARGIDNYYQYVKPALERRQQIREHNLQIQGLHNTSRYQAQNLQQMRQRPGNTPHGTAPRQPATFMNLHRYYPGTSR